ncbi:MAG: serine O-acetyltransferase [Rhodospirillales bacterium]
MAFKRIREDISAYRARDPAARSGLEIILCYPGFHALVAWRLANPLWRARLRLLARFISHIAKILTGVEIHPGARIGRRFVVDHGAGVVIGETSDIGDDVTIYQGVTLGGVAPSVDSAAQVDQKRHPTLEDGVIVGCGAVVLGPITIGKGARIGANAVVTKPAPPGVTAVGNPAKILKPKDCPDTGKFAAYGTPAGVNDPLTETVDALRAEISGLMQRIEELESGRRAEKPAPARGKKHA